MIVEYAWEYVDNWGGNGWQRAPKRRPIVRVPSL